MFLCQRDKVRKDLRERKGKGRKWEEKGGKITHINVIQHIPSASPHMTWGTPPGRNVCRGSPRLCVGMNQTSFRLVKREPISHIPSAILEWRQFSSWRLGTTCKTILSVPDAVLWFIKQSAARSPGKKNATSRTDGAVKAIGIGEKCRTGRIPQRRYLMSYLQTCAVPRLIDCFIDNYDVQWSRGGWAGLPLWELVTSRMGMNGERREKWRRKKRIIIKMTQTKTKTCWRINAH